MVSNFIFNANRSIHTFIHMKNMHTYTHIFIHMIYMKNMHT